MFYQELKKVHIKDGRRGSDMFETFKEQLMRMDESSRAVLLDEFYDEMDEDLTMGTVVDGDDIGRNGQVHIINIDGAEEMFHRESDDTVADDAIADEDDPTSEETVVVENHALDPISEPVPVQVKPMKTEEEPCQDGE